MPGAEVRCSWPVRRWSRGLDRRLRTAESVAYTWADARHWRAAWRFCLSSPAAASIGVVADDAPRSGCGSVVARPNSHGNHCRDPGLAAARSRTILGLPQFVQTDTPRGALHLASPHDSDARRSPTAAAIWCLLPRAVRHPQERTWRLVAKAGRPSSVSDAWIPMKALVRLMGSTPSWRQACLRTRDCLAPSPIGVASAAWSEARSVPKPAGAGRPPLRGISPQLQGVSSSYDHACQIGLAPDAGRIPKRTRRCRARRVSKDATNSRWLPPAPPAAGLREPPVAIPIPPLRTIPGGDVSAAPAVCPTARPPHSRHAHLDPC